MITHSGVELGTVRRINVGSGRYPLLHYCNIDNDPAALCDLLTSVPPLPFECGQLDEVFAGHFLEHLDPEQADLFLNECHRCVRPGGLLAIVVPDTREVMRRYLDHTTEARVEYPIGVMNNCHDLDVICKLFLYSTVQESGHQWSYDLDTLRRLVERHGFAPRREINRWMDPRITIGGWYQCGLEAERL